MHQQEQEFSDEDQTRAVIDAYIKKEGVKVVANKLGVSVKTLRAWKEKYVLSEGKIIENNIKITNKRLSIYNDEDRILTFPISAFPILIGLIYILGYIRISLNLRLFHVAPIYLFDALYFTAGFIPFISLLLVYLTIYYVWYPDRFNLSLLRNFGEWSSIKIKDCFYKRYPLLIIGGYLIVLLWDALTPNSLNSLLDKPSFLALGALSLYSLLGIGVLTYYIRIAVSEPGSIKQIWNEYDNESSFIKRIKILFPKLLIFFLSLCAAIYSLQVMTSTINIIYQELPQEFGGKKLAPIQLILDVNKITGDLQKDIVIDSLGRTKPLCLVYSSQNNYIVVDECSGEFKKLWVLNSNVVLGEIPEIENDK